MSQSLILIDNLSSTFERRKNKIKREIKEKRNHWGIFFPGPEATCLAVCATLDFCSCQVQLKADLRVSL
jgi:hypothetical protein